MKKILPIMAILSLLLPYTVSYGDAGGQVTIINRTGNFLHVVIGGDPFLYLQPGGIITRSSGAGSLFVHAFYSPAQGIEGEADTILSITRVETESATCQDNSCNNKNCSGVSESDHSTSYTSATWTIRPQTLEGDRR
jgi:hypothetical protein